MTKISTTERTAKSISTHFNPFLKFRIEVVLHVWMEWQLEWHWHGFLFSCHISHFPKISLAMRCYFGDVVKVDWMTNRRQYPEETTLPISFLLPLISNPYKRYTTDWSSFTWKNTSFSSSLVGLGCNKGCTKVQMGMSTRLYYTQVRKVNVHLSFFSLFLPHHCLVRVL